MARTELQQNDPQEIHEAVQTELDGVSSAADAVDLEMMIEAMKQHSALHMKRGEIVRQIPHFWAQTVMNSSLVTFFDSEDADAMSYLDNLTVEYPDLEKGDPRPVKLTFSFLENPYFNNKQLVKEFTLKPDAPAVKAEFDLTEVGQTTKTEIDWKDEEHNIAKKNPQVKSSKDDDFDPGSFFSHFFEGTDLEVVGPVATALIVDLWQNAIGIYTGKHENVDLGLFNDDLETDDEDEEDEEDDDEDPNAEIDLEEFDERPKKKARKD